jgi:translation initiation factor eIF-2B subunit epsilon
LLASIRRNDCDLLRPIASSSLFALSPSPENKLLHHEPIGAKPRKKRLNLPGKIFDPKWGEEEIEMRNDLIDCGIDVCSVDVSPQALSPFMSALMISR